MRIGIVTFNSAHNYGAVLQAWSLQTYLMKQGHKVEVINYRPWIIDDVYAMAKKKRLVANQYLNTALNKVRIVKSCITNPQKLKRYRKFEKFIGTKLNVTKVYRTAEEVQRDKKLRYDALVAGSDQIWNSALTKNLDAVYFLDFDRPSVKRISYAASIGGKDIPEVEVEQFRSYLQRIDYISVREQNAKSCLKPLTDKKIEIVADPTFLLKREDFDRLKKKFPVKTPYIYVHNVHLEREDVELNEVAEKLSGQTGLPIVSNRKERFFSNETRKFLTGSPEEFIGVISEAEYVVTNSFHATVFALIYHRNFITIPHFNNPDRMQNLLSELGVLNHLMNAGEMIPADLRELDIDFQELESRKEKMAQFSRQFLKNALKGGKNGGHMEYAGVCVSEIDAAWADEMREKTAYLASARRRHALRDDTYSDVMLPLVKSTLQGKGKAAFPVWREDLRIEYILTDSEEDLKDAAVPEDFTSDLGEIYAKIAEELQKGTRILFFGNACRLLALKNYLGKEYETLTLAETLCRGMTSREIFKRYMAGLEASYQSRPVSLEMRNKFRKPMENFVVYTFASGAVKVENAECEDLNTAIENGFLQELPCYSCILRGGENGCSDLVIAMPEQYEEFEEHAAWRKFAEANESCVLCIETDKGERLWNEASSSFEQRKTDADQLLQKRVEMNGARTEIMLRMKSDADLTELLLEKNVTKQYKKNR